MAEAEVRLEDSWKAVLGGEFAQTYMRDLKAFLQQEKAAGKHIFPKGAEYFRALDLTPLDEVRVVILGQDPYHGAGQAHGLCFSVRPGVRIPPSLVNIYKELQSDLGIPPARHGFLEHWARQGVLLLNSVLTVEEARAASHQGQGWERFTDAVIRAVNEDCDHVVFMLWAPMRRRRRPSSIAHDISCSRRHIPRHCRRITASSAAGTSRRPMNIFVLRAEIPFIGNCPKNLDGATVKYLLRSS